MVVSLCSKSKHMNIKAKKVSKEDYMGRAWYIILVDGEAVTVSGIIQKWSALNAQHAVECYQQFNNQ